MRIAVIAPAKLPIPNVKGGAIETLTTSLLRQNEIWKKFHFDVYSVYDNAAEAESRQFKETSFFYYKRSVIWTLIDKIWGGLYHFSHKRVLPKRSFIFQCIRDVKKNKPDVVLVEGSILQVKQLSKLGVPIVLHEHTDLLNHEEPRSKTIGEYCNQIYVISEFLKKQVVSTGVDAQKVKVFHNAIDLTRFITCPKNESIREKFGIDQSKKIIMYCGRVVPIKGVMELVRAFEIAAIPETVLMIVGGSKFADSSLSDYEREIREYVREHNLNVVFTGYVPYDQLKHYYSNAYFTVCPSICNEAAGLVIVEAHASGSPVIATRIGGIPEYASEENSLLVEYADQEQFVQTLSHAIRSLASDEKTYQLMKEKSREGIEYFSEEQYYKRFSDLMEDFR